jgi:hypothetical protein
LKNIEDTRLKEMPLRAFFIDQGTKETEYLMKDGATRLQSKNGPDGIFLGLSRSELTKFMVRRAFVICEKI